MVTGLTRLTSRVHADEELVPGALLVLIKERDFSASIDVAIARGHKVFELSVTGTVTTVPICPSAS